MREAHEAWWHLEATEAVVEKQTRVKAKLKEAGCRFFACNPTLRGDRFKNMPTAYPIVYWLNPYNQNKNRYGWVTVEDLLVWSEGEGPIPCPEGTSDKRPGAVEEHADPATPLA